MRTSLGVGVGLKHRQRYGTGNALNTIAPSITGTRGGTLTAVPGTWTGATGGVTGQWYSEGVATGNTTLSFTDSDTSKSLEYRETALPGSVVASGYLGASYTPLVLNGDFASGGTNWTADGSVVFSSGRANSTSSANLVSQNVGLVTGKSYSISFDALMTAGNRIRVCNNLGGGINEVLFFALPADSTVHSYSGTFTAQGPYISLEAEFAVFSGWVDNIVVSDITVPITAQASGAPGKKKIDISAIVAAVGATGAQYKIELTSGQLVQTWTAMTFASQVGTAAYNIPDFAYEGQQIRVLVRNVGGTVVTHSVLTLANGYSLQQTMHVSMNESPWAYYEPQVPGRDLFENPLNSGLEVFSTVNFNYHWPIVPNGLSLDTYGHWNEVYNPAQNYPATSTANDDNYIVCVFGSVQWRRTAQVPRSGVAPDLSDPAGTTSGWQAFGMALGSVIGLSNADRPTQLPTDANLTFGYFLRWNGFKASRYPVTVHCATAANVTSTLRNGGANVTKSNVNTGTGTFDLTYSADNIASLTIDRTSTITSGFFMSGVPSYETGSPALDIGAPYASIDKVADLTPFHGYRMMKGSGLERFAGGITGTMTAANNTNSGVSRLWKYQADMANQLGLAALRINVPLSADNTYIDAFAAYLLANTTCTIQVALDNELWNTGELETIELNAEAAGLGISAGQLYGRKLKALVTRFKTAFGAQASRVVGVLEYQLASAWSNWQAILDFETCYTMVGLISAAPYFGGQSFANPGNYPEAPAAVRTAVNNNDQSAFNTAMDTEVTASIDQIVAIVRSLQDSIANYSVSKGLNKNAIGYDSYEGGQSPEWISSSWDTGLGAGKGASGAILMQTYRRSANMASRVAYFVDQLATKAPHNLYVFMYAEAQDTRYGWGSMERMSNQTDEPYATYKTKALLYA